MQSQGSAMDVVLSQQRLPCSLLPWKYTGCKYDFDTVHQHCREKAVMWRIVTCFDSTSQSQT